MNSVMLILRDTIKKEMRNKALIVIFILNILLFAIVSMGLDFIIGFVGNSGLPMDLNSQKIHVFMFFINKWTGLLAILFGISCVKSDEEEGLLGQVLSLPIGRNHYLIGRIFGAATIVFCFYLFLCLMGGIGILMSGGNWPFGLNFFLAAPIKCFYILSIILISVLISFFSSKILSFLLMIILFILVDISGAMNAGKNLGELFTELSIFKVFNLIVFILFPHLPELDKFNADLLFKTNDVVNPILELSHMVFSFGVLYLILWLIFRKKEV